MNGVGWSFRDFHKRYPLPYYTIYFIAGIFIGTIYSVPLICTITASSILIIICILLYYFLFPRLNSILKLSISLNFLVSGIFGINLQNTRVALNTEPFIDGTNRVKIVVLEAPSHTGNTTVIRSNLEHMRSNITVSIYSGDKKLKLSPGDTLVINFKNTQLKKSDFGNYYLYLHKSGCKVNKFSGRNLLIDVLTFREKIKNLASKRFTEKENQSIFNALILGDKSLLSKKSKESFINAGIMHILAISGMHTGYLYSILLVILFPLGNGKISLFLRNSLIICTIWFYAILSGFSESVIRASIMISINLIASIFDKGKISLNTLGASALIMLVINPLSLYNAGFQLSFMATFSIIVIYPHLNKIFTIKSRVGAYLWQNLAMSISGTLGTFLISILTFGRFPIYFLLGNLLAAPLIPIIMVTSFMWLIIPSGTQLEGIIFFISDSLIFLLNSIATNVGALPYSSISLK